MKNEGKRLTRTDYAARDGETTTDRANLAIDGTAALGRVQSYAERKLLPTAGLSSAGSALLIAWLRS